jgi:RimJ/RimL family protein N-acetyltransferase
MSTPPTLYTERLALRELRLTDAEDIAASAGDKRVARFLIQVPSPYPVSLARRWITGRIEWWETGRGVTYAIATRKSETLVGTVSLRRFARDRRAELGYWIAHRDWGKGYTTEAARALVAYGFDHLDLTRIYAQVIAGNEASVRVLAKLGMVAEGVKRQHVRKGAKNVDVGLYGLLRDEWR